MECQLYREKALTWCQSNAVSTQLPLLLTSFRPQFESQLILLSGTRTSSRFAWKWICHLAYPWLWNKPNIYLKMMKNTNNKNLYKFQSWVTRTFFQGYLPIKTSKFFPTWSFWSDSTSKSIESNHCRISQIKIVYKILISKWTRKSIKLSCMGDFPASPRNR